MWPVCPRWDDCRSQARSFNNILVWCARKRKKKTVFTGNCVLFWVGVGMGFMPISILSTARILDKIYDHREAILDWMLGLNVWAATQGLAATIALFAIVSGATIVLWSLGLLEGYWLLVAAVVGGVTVCIPFLLEVLTDIPLKKAGWIREG